MSSSFKTLQQSLTGSCRFLYTKILCMDANFRLKNQLVSSFSSDPGLGIGMAYMVPRESYDQYVLSRTQDDDVGLSLHTFTSIL